MYGYKSDGALGRHTRTYMDTLAMVQLDISLHISMHKFTRTYTRTYIHTYTHTYVYGYIGDGTVGRVGCVGVSAADGRESSRLLHALA